MMNRNVAGVGMTSGRARARLIGRLKEQGISNRAVLDAIENTPRHLFVDEALESRAYDDVSLPIGFSQTISQPYTVARMTEVLLAGGAVQNVLEVGTGSGFQTSILARLVENVYTVERIKTLQDRARRVLNSLKQRNISFRCSDGVVGWSVNAPYDGIIVTAAAKEIPLELIEQLRIGGRMVIPVGEGGCVQNLNQIVRTTRGIERCSIENARFVPLMSGILK